MTNREGMGARFPQSKPCGFSCIPFQFSTQSRPVGDNGAEDQASLRRLGVGQAGSDPLQQAAYGSRGCGAGLIKPPSTGSIQLKRVWGMLDQTPFNRQHTAQEGVGQAGSNPLQPVAYSSRGCGAGWTKPPSTGSIQLKRVWESVYARLVEGPSSYTHGQDTTTAS